MAVPPTTVQAGGDHSPSTAASAARPAMTTRARNATFTSGLHPSARSENGIQDIPSLTEETAEKVTKGQRSERPVKIGRSRSSRRYEQDLVDLVSRNICDTPSKLR